MKTPMIVGFELHTYSDGVSETFRRAFVIRAATQICSDNNRVRRTATQPRRHFVLVRQW